MACNDCERLFGGVKPVLSPCLLFGCLNCAESLIARQLSPIDVATARDLLRRRVQFGFLSEGEFAVAQRLDKRLRDYALARRMGLLKLVEAPRADVHGTNEDS